MLTYCSQQADPAVQRAKRTPEAEGGEEGRRHARGESPKAYHPAIHPPDGSSELPLTPLSLPLSLLLTPSPITLHDHDPMPRLRYPCTTPKSPFLSPCHTPTRAPVHTFRRPQQQMWQFILFFLSVWFLLSIYKRGITPSCLALVIMRWAVMISDQVKKKRRRRIMGNTLVGKEHPGLASFVV